MEISAKIWLFMGVIATVYILTATKLENIAEESPYVVDWHKIKPEYISKKPEPDFFPVPKPRV